MEQPVDNGLLPTPGTMEIIPQPYEKIWNHYSTIALTKESKRIGQRNLWLETILRSDARSTVVSEDHQARMAIMDTTQESFQHKHPPELTKAIKYLRKDANTLMKIR